MLEDRHYMRNSPYRSMWSMTTILIAANVLAFVLQYGLEYFRIPVTHALALSLDGLKSGKLYQLITFQFLHGGVLHLLGNVLAIFFFGRAMEEILGSKNFLKLYFMGGCVGGLMQMLFAFLVPNMYGHSVVGASAGAAALIAAFATHSPDQPITMLLFFVIPITFPAKVLLLIEGAITVFGIAFPSGPIAHAAHLGGLLTGIIYIRWLGRSNRAVMVWRPFRRRSPKREYAKVVPMKDPWKPKIVEPELPPAEFMAQEVDPILDKISAHGIQSLTDRERQILEAARKKMARK